MLEVSAKCVVKNFISTFKYKARCFNTSLRQIEINPFDAITKNSGTFPKTSSNNEFKRKSTNKAFKSFCNPISASLSAEHNLSLFFFACHLSKKNQKIDTAGKRSIESC